MLSMYLTLDSGSSVEIRRNRTDLFVSIYEKNFSLSDRNKALKNVLCKSGIIITPIAFLILAKFIFQ